MDFLTDILYIYIYTLDISLKMILYDNDCELLEILIRINNYKETIQNLNFWIFFYQHCMYLYHFEYRFDDEESELNENINKN